MMLIQRKLECVTNPPEAFYNDPKSRTFDVVLRLTAPEHLNDEVPVVINILYERGELVDNQSILEKILNPGLIRANVDTVFRFRINQVSRSHLNRRFLLRFRLQDGSDLQVETTAVHVFSKMASKRSRGKKNLSSDEAKRQKVDTSADKKWISSAVELFKDIAWTRCGYESGIGESGEEILDRTRPIYRCVCCSAMSCGTQANAHNPGCKLRIILQAQKQACAPPIDPAPAPQPHALPGDLDDLDMANFESTLGEGDDNELFQLAGDLLKECFKDPPQSGDNLVAASNGIPVKDAPTWDVGF